MYIKVAEVHVEELPVMSWRAREWKEVYNGNLDLCP